MSKGRLRAFLTNIKIACKIHFILFVNTFSEAKKNILHLLQNGVYHNLLRIDAMRGCIQKNFFFFVDYEQAR